VSHSGPLGDSFRASGLLVPPDRYQGLLGSVAAHEEDIARIEAMVQDIRAIRDRTCEPKDRSNPRYHALSMSVSGLVKAIDDMRRDG
jgi:hypothetical protein